MSPRQRWTHRLALATVVVTLALPVMMGSLTTTLGAGMAFLDWPTSDGQNILFYDMFYDIRVGNTDKVAEHGHRLAGMIVGLLSIPLALLGWGDGRRGVRALTLGILLGVIAQGLLGGARVRLDARALAMIHSIGAALIVPLMGLTAVVTSRAWRKLVESRARPGGALAAIAVLTPVLIVVQYVAGGFVRHFGTAIPEHLGGAAVVGVVSLAAAMLAAQSGIRELRPFGWGLFATVVVQILLGVGAWAGKFGMAAFGVVVVDRGPFQVTLRTLHTAGGMTLLMAAVLLAAAVLRLRAATRTAPATCFTLEEQRPRGTALAGGVR